jgi:hypothetical protein
MLPTSMRLISTRTGAPAARALALGFHEPTKGTIAPTTPAAPTTEVDPNKNRLRPESVPSSLTVNSPELFLQKKVVCQKNESMCRGAVLTTPMRCAALNLTHI